MVLSCSGVKDLAASPSRASGRSRILRRGGWAGQETNARLAARRMSESAVHPRLEKYEGETRRQETSDEHDYPSRPRAAGHP